MPRKPHKKINYHEHEEPKNFPNISNVASANESTGMMPTPAQNREEYRSYQELGSMAIPKKAPGLQPAPEKRRVSVDRPPRSPYL